MMFMLRVPSWLVSLIFGSAIVVNGRRLFCSRWKATIFGFLLLISTGCTAMLPKPVVVLVLKLITCFTVKEGGDFNGFSSSSSSSSYVSAHSAPAASWFSEMNMALCAFPRFVESAGGIVPCGSCVQCRINKQRQKVTRILLENSTHEDAFFVTVTYDQAFLPVDIFNPVTGELEFSHPTGCLDKRGYQLFLKRVRRALPPKTVRFVGVGEYGEKRGRPHYHFIFWGIPEKKLSVLYDAWTCPYSGRLMCHPDQFQIERPRDQAHVAQYVSGYVTKKFTRPDNPDLQGRPPEFCTWSKGLGLTHVKKLADNLLLPHNLDAVRAAGDIPRFLIINGRKWPIDRYMRDKILDFMGDEGELIRQTAREAFAQEMQALQERAAANPSNPFSYAATSEFDRSKTIDEKRFRWSLETQLQLEKADDVRVSEAKLRLFKPKKEL